MKKLELYYPCKPLGVNQPFGTNFNDFYKKLGMKGHNGIDFLAPDSTIIRACHDGVVTFTGEDGSAGLGVVLRTTEAVLDKDGDNKFFFKTIYWHIKKGSFKVKPGDLVKIGDVLALADNTGMSTGAHLHFGLKPVLQGEEDWSWSNIFPSNGYFGAIDPMPYFNGQFAEDVYRARWKGVIGLLEMIVAKLRGK